MRVATEVLHELQLEERAARLQTRAEEAARAAEGGEESVDEEGEEDAEDEEGEGDTKEMKVGSLKRSRGRHSSRRFGVGNAGFRASSSCCLAH